MTLTNSLDFTIPHLIDVFGHAYAEQREWGLTFRSWIDVEVWFRQWNVVISLLPSMKRR